MNKLSSDTIRLLSSSQVVTSVSSAVKELVENALDAGATSLDVKLEKWGLDKIEVRDNGCGIKECDTSVMAQRYYTSKISKHEDLSHLSTYGFRGEALGSLCQIADVCITTKTAEDTVATCYVLDHAGKITSKKPTHDGNGTTVMACNLFKNLPVRKQFYNNAKKSKEELKKIEDILMAYGLMNPHVRVTLKNNKSLAWQKNKSSDFKTAMMDVFGIQVYNQLNYFEYCDDDLKLSLKCFVPNNDSDPQLTSRSTEDRCFIFVNKRFVVWKELIQVFKKHCVWRNVESNAGRFPLCFVTLELPPQDIDANLEPNKTRVLIRQKEEILEIISSELSKLYESGCRDRPNCVKETDGTNATKHNSDVGQNYEYTNTLRTCTNTSRNTEGRLNGTSSGGPDNGSQRNVSGRQRTDLQDTVEILTENGDGTRKIDGILARSHCNGEDEVCANQRNDNSEINRDISNKNNCNENMVDCSSREIDVMVNEPGRLLEQNGFMEDGEDSSVEKNIAKNGCKEYSSSTPLSPGHRKQSEFNDLSGDLVDDLDSLDDSTFIIDPPLPNLDQWSKGQGLHDKSGNNIEPVKLLVPSVQSKTGTEKETSSSSLTLKRKHSSTSDKDSSSPKSNYASKRIKKIHKISGQTLLTSVLKSPETTKATRTVARTTTKRVSFSLSSLKELAGNKRQVMPPPDDMKLIKRLDPWGVWVVSKKRKLFILNPYRIQELLLYKRLLATHVIPREKLGKPIILDERILGDASRYCMLETLIIENKGSGNTKYCDDERLLANGFEILRRTDPESGKVRLEILKMNTTIPYFGVHELIEVLDLIKEKQNRSRQVGTEDNCLTWCRPSKVCNYLKDEVVRVARGLPSRLAETDIEMILDRMKNELKDEEDTCIHNLPFLYPLTSY